MTEDFPIFPSIKLIFWVHLLNKSRKIQYTWHGFFNGMYATNIDLTLSTTSNVDPFQLMIVVIGRYLTYF